MKFWRILEKFKSFLENFIKLILKKFYENIKKNLYIDKNKK